MGRREALMFALRRAVRLFKNVHRGRDDPFNFHMTFSTAVCIKGLPFADSLFVIRATTLTMWLLGVTIRVFF